MPLQFDALIRAHGFMKTERPPSVWEADTEDVRFIPLLGEMIAAGLSGGSTLETLTLNVSNIVAPEDAEDDPANRTVLPAGEYVAVTVRGITDLGPDQVWFPGRPLSDRLLLGRLDTELTMAGVRYAYVRRIPPEGSVTVMLARSNR